MKIKLSERFLEDMKYYHGLSEEEVIQNIVELCNEKGIEVNPDKVHVDIKGNFSLRNKDD